MIHFFYVELFSLKEEKANSLMREYENGRWFDLAFLLVMYCVWIFCNSIRSLCSTIFIFSNVVFVNGCFKFIFNQLTRFYLALSVLPVARLCYPGLLAREL